MKLNFIFSAHNAMNQMYAESSHCNCQPNIYSFRRLSAVAIVAVTFCPYAFVSVLRSARFPLGVGQFSDAVFDFLSLVWFASLFRARARSFTHWFLGLFHGLYRVIPNSWIFTTTQCIHSGVLLLLLLARALTRHRLSALSQREAWAYVCKHQKLQ